jgi:hypothetical protein
MYNVVKLDKTKGRISDGLQLQTLKSQYFLLHGLKDITIWNQNLPFLCDGSSLFTDCKNLKTFEAMMPLLYKGYMMFRSCSNLNSIKTSFDLLSDCTLMFQDCYALKSFNINLPALASIDRPFLNCTSLQSFDADCESATTINGMFQGCTSFTTFNSYMPLLNDAINMFYNCVLSPKSVAIVLNMLKSSSGGAKRILIGCGCTIEDKDIFAQEVGFADFEAMNNYITIDKGWNTTWQFNAPTTQTYSLKGVHLDGHPIFAKLVEVDKETATYTAGEKFYMLEWGHVVCDNTYQEFSSLEEAEEFFNLQKINTSIENE